MDVLSLGLAAGMLFFAFLAAERSLKARNSGRREKELEEEVRALSEMNEMLTENLARKGRMSERQVSEFVRELEILRTAIAGSGICEAMLKKKYKCDLGPVMLRKIFGAYPSISMLTKQGLADAILVGELGRMILKELDAGAKIEDLPISTDAPLGVIKTQIRRLQLMGYLDGTLRLTASGRRVLAHPA